MKRIAIFFALALSCSAVMAQEKPQNAVKINPLSLFFLTGNFSYERAVNENQSFQIGMFYSGVSISGLKYSGLGLTPEYRFYVGGHKEALNGVYVAPFARYQHFSLKDKETSDEAKYTAFGGGATIGWEKSYSSGFVLDIFVGPAYNSGTLKDNSVNSDFDVAGSFDGFTIRTGISLGFSF